MRSDLVDLEVAVHRETEKAVLVSIDGDRASAVWLPLSAIEFERRRDRRHIASVTLPENLAISKGLV